MKDDSGSFAVFTEQGSSASQMTAANVMDIFSRLPGCAGLAADAVICLHSTQNGRCSKIAENSKIGMSRHLDTSTTDTCLNHGPVWKIQSFLCMEPDWEKFLIGNVYSCTERKDYSCLCMWMISNWLERNKILTHCGKY